MHAILPASLQLTSNRGIKLFEVCSDVVERSLPVLNQQQIAYYHPLLLQIFSKQARTERRRKLKVHLTSLRTGFALH